MLTENPSKRTFINKIRTIFIVKKNKIYKLLIIKIRLKSFGEFVF